MMLLRLLTVYVDSMMKMKARISGDETECMENDLLFMGYEDDAV